MPNPVDPVLWNDWHVVADLSALRPAVPFRTTLLDTPVRISCADGRQHVGREDGAPVNSALRYGFIWACLGEPARDIVDIPEAAETWRCVATSGAFGIHASAPRVVENFLDLGHLPHVHRGYLGAEPETAIDPYTVDLLPEGGLIARGCRIYQPQASPAAKEGFVVDYVYKVVRPLVACLFKANPVRDGVSDAIYLLLQPVGEERTIANVLMLFGPDNTSAAELRAFQQIILLQDKPILENQEPRRLPIAPRMEIPIASDMASVAYRKWLAKLGFRYGTVTSLETAP